MPCSALRTRSPSWSTAPSSHPERPRRFAAIRMCRPRISAKASRRTSPRGSISGLRIVAATRSAEPPTIAHEAMGTLVEARDVHAHYGESHVLRGVSLAIHPGESIGLLGRNGMGKTTLIRTLLGLTRATGGKVLVHGRDCTQERPHRIARMGVAYVPEGR